MHLIKQFILTCTVQDLFSSCRSYLWQNYILGHVIFFYLSFSSFHRQSHWFMPICTIFSQWFTCHKSGSSGMVIVSDLCSIHTIALYHLLITNAVSIDSGHFHWFVCCSYHSTLSLAYYKLSLYWQWSLSLICAQFILYFDQNNG